MALFKVLRGTAASIDKNNANKPPFVDGYAYFTPDDGRFYIDVELASDPPYYYDKATVGGKTIYRIEIESKTWAELVNTKSNVGHKHPVSDLTDHYYNTFNSPLSEDANHAVSLNTVGVGKGGTGVTTLASGEVLIGNGTSAVTTKAIDTTSGGTNNSSNLITSGAVYSGLAGKAASGHHHTISEIDDIIDVQSDWDETDSTKVSFIKNKPTIINVGITMNDNTKTMYITTPITSGDGVNY